MTAKGFAERAEISLRLAYAPIVEGRGHGTEGVARLQPISDSFTRYVPGRERDVVDLLKAAFSGVYEALKRTLDEIEAVALFPPQRLWSWFRKERAE